MCTVDHLHLAWPGELRQLKTGDRLKRFPSPEPNPSTNQLFCPSYHVSYSYLSAGQRIDPALQCQAGTVLVTNVTLKPIDTGGEGHLVRGGHVEQQRCG